MNRRATETLGYTLVMHSGGGYANKPGFKQAVEERAISNAHELDKVRRVGGLVLADYGTAADRAEAENYPEGYAGFYPAAPGTFSQATLDQLRIYIPAPTQEPANA